MNQKKLTMWWRWSIITTSMTSLFWLTWFLISGSVPEIKWFWESSWSRPWLDIPVIPIWTGIFIFLFTLKEERKDEDKWKPQEPLSVFQFAGLGCGGLFGFSFGFHEAITGTINLVPFLIICLFFSLLSSGFLFTSIKDDVTKKITLTTAFILGSVCGFGIPTGLATGIPIAITILLGTGMGIAIGFPIKLLWQKTSPWLLAKDKK